jgi:hypothetical protein
MFMAYAVVIGLIVGLLLGGRIGRLADLRLKWAGLAITALMVQVALFTEPVYVAVGDLVPFIYMASTGVVLVVIVRNLRRVPGLVIVALGACSNLAAIIANGGYMPATPEALGITEPVVTTTYHANSVTTPDPALALLVDRFSLPDWVPFSNVFSIGDVLISFGIVVVMVVAMRRRAPEPAGTSRAAPMGVAVRSRESTGSAPAP